MPRRLHHKHFPHKRTYQGRQVFLACLLLMRLRANVCPGLIVDGVAADECRAAFIQSSDLYLSALAAQLQDGFVQYADGRYIPEVSRTHVYHDLVHDLLEVYGLGQPLGGCKEHLSNVKVGTYLAVRRQAGVDGEQLLNLAGEEQATEDDASQHAPCEVMCPNDYDHCHDHHNGRLPGIRPQIFYRAPTEGPD